MRWSGLEMPKAGDDSRDKATLEATNESQIDEFSAHPEVYGLPLIRSC